MRQTMYPLYSVLRPFGLHLTKLQTTPIPSALTPVSSALTPIPSALTPVSSALTPIPSALAPVSSALTPIPSALAPIPSYLCRFLDVVPERAGKLESLEYVRQQHGIPKVRCVNADHKGVGAGARQVDVECAAQNRLGRLGTKLRVQSVLTAPRASLNGDQSEAACAKWAEWAEWAECAKWAEGAEGAEWAEWAEGAEGAECAEGAANGHARTRIGRDRRQVECAACADECAASPGVDCRPANGRPPAGNKRRIFNGIFEMPCAEWFTSVDSRRLSTVELKSKAFLAAESGAWCAACTADCAADCAIDCATDCAVTGRSARLRTGRWGAGTAATTSRCSRGRTSPSWWATRSRTCASGWTSGCPPWARDPTASPASSRPRRRWRMGSSRGCSISGSTEMTNSDAGVGFVYPRVNA
eukprot:1182040-Prorocentrum_minimum.AAC.2